MDENNGNDDFMEFLRKMSESAQNYDSNGDNSQNPFNNLEDIFKMFGNNGLSMPQNSNSPSPEDMQSMLNMFLGGMNGNNGMPQSNEEISHMMEHIIRDLQQNIQAIGLPQLSGADADEMMRVLQELFSNIGQQKKNPLEDVDTSNMDDELEKLLKESVKNSVNHEDKESSTDNTDSKEKETVDENVNNDNNEEEIDNNKPTRISLTNVKASFKNSKMVVESSVPEGFSNGLVNVSTSLENETLTVSYSIDEKLFESVVRVRGLKNKGVVAFDKSASEIQLSDEKWIITVGLIVQPDISFESDL